MVNIFPWPSDTSLLLFALFLFMATFALLVIDRNFISDIGPSSESQTGTILRPVLAHYRSKLMTDVAFLPTLKQKLLQSSSIVGVSIFQSAAIPLQISTTSPMQRPLRE
jgi:hypothetical protein